MLTACLVALGKGRPVACSGGGAVAVLGQSPGGSSHRRGWLCGVVPLAEEWRRENPGPGLCPKTLSGRVTAASRAREGCSGLWGDSGGGEGCAEAQHPSRGVVGRPVRTLVMRISNGHLNSLSSRVLPRQRDCPSPRSKIWPPGLARLGPPLPSTGQLGVKPPPPPAEPEGLGSPRCVHRKQALQVEVVLPGYLEWNSAFTEGRALARWDSGPLCGGGGAVCV